MNTTTPASEEEEEYKVSRVIGNEIFYYGEITDVDILEFIEDFKKLSYIFIYVAKEVIYSQG